MKNKGGRFNMAKPKNDVEWMIYNAGTIPGPGAYTPDQQHIPAHSGRFNTSKPKSDIDWKVYQV